MKLHLTPRRAALAGIAAVGILVAVGVIVVPALATPPSGVATTMFGVGRFDDIDAKTKTDIDPGTPTDFWQARIKTKGARISMSWRTRSRRAGRSAGTAIPGRAW